MNRPATTLILVLALAACLPAAPNDLTPLGKIAWQESATPIRPGRPGQAPFWNQRVRQFIYAPAFDFKPVENAVAYRFDLTSLTDASTYTFTAEVPWAPLSPVWASVPVGLFELKVTALSAAGEPLGLAGQGQWHRAAAFNGPYHQPAMPYDASARLALDRLLAKDYVQYWFEHRAPDTDYINYRFPAKIWSALVIGAITHARLHHDSPDADRSTDLARIIADKMIEISFQPGSPWEYFVPTYYGPHAENAPKQHLKPINFFSIMGCDAGHAFLDLYDLTADEKYLAAARRIADTYLKTQLENGSWHQFVNHQTGQPTADNIVIPTAMIAYFNRLQRDYHVPGLETATARALQWTMQNPVRTFDWQGQFEDVFARPPYQNLSREQACELAMHLFKNNRDPELALDLVRFAEDQFVIWEQPPDVSFKAHQPGGKSENWITPSVQEQYVYWMPVARSAGIMLDTWMHAFHATKDEIFRAKAASLANSFTLNQQAHDGDYTTFFTPYNLPLWLNSTVYPAKLLMQYHNDLTY